MKWKPIKTLPKDWPRNDQEIDIWAKRWRSDDTWEYKRFPKIWRNGLGEIFGQHSPDANGWCPIQWVEISLPRTNG